MFLTQTWQMVEGGFAPTPAHVNTIPLPPSLNNSIISDISQCYGNESDLTVRSLNDTANSPISISPAAKQIRGSLKYCKLLHYLL